MEKESRVECAKCSVKERICSAENGRGPGNCPTVNRAEVIREATKEYEKEDIRKFAQMASIQEAAGYSEKDRKPYVLHPVKPRVQEICEFAHRMGYKRLGIAFCLGLSREARIATEIFEAQGFEVSSACCKAGRTEKEAIGLTEDDKIRINEFETMCSPIAQAALLNSEKTDFNVLVGLCVGHDSLFFKYSEAPVTVLVAKDRLTAHNPAAALYTYKSYYQRMTREGF